MELHKMDPLELDRQMGVTAFEVQMEPWLQRAARGQDNEKLLRQKLEKAFLWTTNTRVNEAGGGLWSVKNQKFKKQFF